MVAFVKAREDEVAAFHQPERPFAAGIGLAEHMVHPWPGGIDNLARRYRAFAIRAAQGRRPAIGRAFQRGALGARANVRAAFARIHAVEHDKPRILHPAIRIFESLSEAVLQNGRMRFVS
ncbi:hypothetical protein AAW01_08890 [Aurantiacibacter gangjinensis]|uniref:Uncharacterized protein n=1 Tax=Aurantiacibacter gangjinensis TaxID=502682 RepID=A0A0G9MLQ3_9SPHN|nr:hypothetical protein AAW01_08890 [Aurantiacibacter gangjinensis]